VVERPRGVLIRTETAKARRLAFRDFLDWQRAGKASAGHSELNYAASLWNWTRFPGCLQLFPLLSQRLQSRHLLTRLNLAFAVFNHRQPPVSGLSVPERFWSDIPFAGDCWLRIIREAIYVSYISRLVI
jgi:hypothetical protein